MNSTAHHSLSSLTTDALLNLGIVTFSTAPYADIPMTQVVKTLLSSDLNLTALLGPAFAAAGVPETASPRTVLLALDALFETSPHDSSATYVHTLEIAFTSVATAFLTLRFVGRKCTTGIIRWDDWTMLGAWIMTIAFLAGILLSTAFAHTCHHVYDLSYSQWRNNFLITYICEILFSLCNLLIKLSWLFFYHTLSNMPFFRRSVLFIGAFSILLTFAAVTATVFQCHPIDFWSDPLNAKCINLTSSALAIGTLALLSDFTVLLLPIPVVIYTLRLAPREKAIVVGMFAAGTFACYAGIIRVAYVNQFIADPDMPYKEAYAGLWALVELDLSIAISSVPAIRGLVRRVFPKYCRNSMVTVGGVRVPKPPQGSGDSSAVTTTIAPVPTPTVASSSGVAEV